MATDTTGQQTIDVVTPAAGESVSEGTILEWQVKVGDFIKADDTIVEISTDKVDLELPSPASGTVTEILVAEGDTVTVGQVIARIALAGDGEQSAPGADGAQGPAADGNGAGNGSSGALGGRDRRPRRRDTRSARRRGHARRRRVGLGGHDPRMAREGRRRDQGGRHDRRDIDRQGRRRAARAGQRHGRRAARARRARRSRSAR